MDVLKKLGVPLDQIEFGIKITFQTAIIAVGLFGNVHTIYNVSTKSRLPRATNMFIIALSLALFLQVLNACIDYVNHLYNQDHYALGLAACDTWHTLNVYFPMLLALLCFFALMDRFVLLARPDLHAKAMSPAVVAVMVIFSFLVPLFVTVPPVYFKWYTTHSHMRWRTDKECKFKVSFCRLLGFWGIYIMLQIDTM